ncbi:hypothetical protein ACR80S_06865 [Halomonas sp. MA07-2]
MSLRHPWRRETALLLVAAGLAIWLLLQPGLIQGLPFTLRLPAVLLGIWALGAAFLRPLAPAFPHPLLCRALSPHWSQLALALFALLMVLRALLA